MKNIVKLIIVVALVSATSFAGEPPAFSTQWITSKPEMMTYRSIGAQGNGLYQVSTMARDTTIEVYINIITKGFTKTVSGVMTRDMRPLQSTAKIIIDGQVAMETNCLYRDNNVKIKTVMMPYNKTVADSMALPDPVIDFSQTPLLVRTLHLDMSSRYSFGSMNPNTNRIIPLTIVVVGEGQAGGVDCYKVSLKDFEGESIYWVEKGSRHRVMLVEQPSTHRTTELIQ